MKGCIRILNIKDNPDGSAIINFEYDKTFAKQVRGYYHKKRASKKMVSKFVSMAMDASITLHSKKFLKDLKRKHGKRK